MTDRPYPEPRPVPFGRPAPVRHTTRPIAAVVALVLAGCSERRPATTTAVEPAHDLADRFDALRRDRKIPGIAAVVLRGSDAVLSRGFGHADIERQVPVTTDTPFDIASVTKPLSAVVALRLAELGTLDLDTPMERFDGFREFAVAAVDRGGVFFRDYAEGPTPLTLRHVLGMTANGNPGSRFLYNPPSYSWASRPMAQAAGRPFSELTAEYVLRPAGMTRSARFHRKLTLPGPLAADLARPYHTGPDGRVVPSDPPDPQGDGAAGGIVSTAADLARFDVALGDGRLLTPESRRAMWAAGRSPAGAARPYGLGWFVQEYRGEPLVWHSGLWEGKYSALYLKAPARNLTLILLANSDGLRWDNGLDEAAVERSPFAAAFLDTYPR